MDTRCRLRSAGLAAPYGAAAAAAATLAIGAAGATEAAVARTDGDATLQRHSGRLGRRGLLRF